ncbi:hypothetical protein B4U45_01540 [Mycobacterium persicum]|uniref:Cytochrome P450 n=1 Tax=Mycobacterium persicum TaxID=1487726 RepID=A0A8E2IQN3_9MYCO|nr:hypothetical protein A4G31_01495 [Mycobacterium persicum]ORB93477.1 hypothetical protein B1T44_01590 [Mycobacterium persicum]ORC05551.1 hypothetical protein B4U45_01540 [Mycobacterium persicum]VAZ76242.1 hypothetical protein LAUMK15_03218 [Mycobacterium persicum]VAZ94717.1 hypothetical protein LAUMK4_02892 [Mycobacterium persicum]
MRLGSNARSVALASGRMLVVTDGTAHRRLRAAHSAWLSSSTINRMSSEIKHDIELLVTDLMGTGGSFDGLAWVASVLIRKLAGFDLDR